MIRVNFSFICNLSCHAVEPFFAIKVWCWQNDRMLVLIFNNSYGHFFCPRYKYKDSPKTTYVAKFFEQYCTKVLDFAISFMYLFLYLTRLRFVHNL
jgi:hypothetical protein